MLNVERDALRRSRARLNAYKGLSSEAYISLTSKDPILTAFELSEELTHLSHVEKHFRSEYLDLSTQVNEYVVKLLDRCRGNEELDVLLNKTGPPDLEMYEPLARLNLAIQYGQKRFVAHPNCQQKLMIMWYQGIRMFERLSVPKKLLVMGLYILFLPILSFIQLAAPNSKVSG
jgi:hypothetical protein